jgi:hypothetical protein
VPLDSLVTPSATRVAGFQTATSGVRRVIWRHDPTVGFRGDLRARSCAACDDPDLPNAHPKSGRVTHRSRCPLRAQSDAIYARREMT